METDRVYRFTISDFEKIRSADGKYVMRNGIGSGNDFSRDPDHGTLSDRLSGRFDWAFNEIAKHKDSSGLGNVESLQPEFEFGMLDGTEVDFDQYMIHNPRCLGRIYNNPSCNGERTISLAICVGMSGGTESHELASKSAGALAVAKKYEEAGYSVKLHVVIPLLDTNDRRVFLVSIDCSSASVGQTISVACSALVFRSIIFDALVRHGRDPRSSQAVSRIQNSHLLPEMGVMIKRAIGADTKIVWTGDTDKEIMAEMQS